MIHTILCRVFDNAPRLEPGADLHLSASRRNEGGRSQRRSYPIYKPTNGSNFRRSSWDRRARSRSRSGSRSRSRRRKKSRSKTRSRSPHERKSQLRSHVGQKEKSMEVTDSALMSSSKNESSEEEETYLQVERNGRCYRKRKRAESSSDDDNDAKDAKTVSETEKKSKAKSDKQKKKSKHEKSSRRKK